MTELVSPPQGLLLIDKPAGWSSHRVVNAVRRATGVKRVGHTGTLDPFATGLLLILVGRSYTRLQSTYLKQDKTYECEVTFGYQTTTLDSTGEIITTADATSIATLTKQTIVAACKKLVGTYEQLAPAFAAIKINGVKLYDRALHKLKDDSSHFTEWEQTLPRRTVTINTLQVTDWHSVSGDEKPQCKLMIDCSSGTYIRALVRDLGTLVGVVATTTNLRRTSIGEFTVSAANSIDQPEKWHWHTVEP